MDAQDRLAAGAVRRGDRRPGGRTARGAAAPGRGSRAGWSRRARSRRVRGSNPSISVRIWLSVCSRSSWPPEMFGPPEARERPIASSSSMKMIAGAACLGLREQIAHARGADADDHLDELRRGHLEERHAGLAGHRPREQRLAGAGRPLQQHAARDPAAELQVLVRVLEEVDDLGQLLLGLVDPGDVVEGDRAGPGPRRGARASGRTTSARRRRRRPPPRGGTPNTSSSRNSSVGPKPKIRLVRNDGPVFVGWALIVTLFFWSSLEQLLVVGERRDLGREVARSCVPPAGYLTAFLNVPSIDVAGRARSTDVVVR